MLWRLEIVYKGLPYQVTHLDPQVPLYLPTTLVDYISE